MACSHLFQIVPIQIIYGLSECKNLVEVVPLLLDKSNNLLKFDFVKNDCLFSDFNFSKKKQFYLNTLGCQQERVIHQTFEGLNLKAVLQQIRYFGDVISTNIPRASGSFLSLTLLQELTQFV